MGIMSNCKFLRVCAALVCVDTVRLCECFRRQHNTERVHCVVDKSDPAKRRLDLTWSVAPADDPVASIHGA